MRVDDRWVGVAQHKRVGEPPPRRDRRDCVAIGAVGDRGDVGRPRQKVADALLDEAFCAAFPQSLRLTNHVDGPRKVELGL